MTTLKQIKAQIATVLNVESVNSEYMRHWHKDVIGDRNLRSKDAWEEIYHLLVGQDTLESMNEQGYINIPVTESTCQANVDEARNQLSELNDDIESIKEEIEIRKQALARVQRQIQLQQAVEILKEDMTPYETACKLTDTTYDPTVESIHPIVCAVPVPQAEDLDPQIDEAEEFLLFSVCVFMTVLCIMSIGFIPTLLCGVVMKWHNEIYHAAKLTYYIGKELRKNAHDIINLCTAFVA